MIWITSDQHFNHLNILKFEPNSRPFNSIEEMNEALIRNWNSCVKDDDTIYVLGDFFMGKLDDVEPILNRLKGHIILIRGNHDTSARLELYRQHGIEVKDIDYLTYKGQFFILSHFPITNEEFIKMVRNDNSEVVVLYGHVHHNAPIGYHDGTYHIGVDTNNLTPLSIHQIWKECWTKGIEHSAAEIQAEDRSRDPVPAIAESRCGICKYENICHSYDFNNHCRCYRINIIKWLKKKIKREA